MVTQFVIFEKQSRRIRPGVRELCSCVHRLTALVVNTRQNKCTLYAGNKEIIKTRPTASQLFGYLLYIEQQFINR